MNRSQTFLTVTVAAIISPYIFGWFVSMAYGMLFADRLTTSAGFWLIGTISSTIAGILVMGFVAYLVKSTQVYMALFFWMVFLIAATLGMIATGAEENIYLFYKSPNTWTFLITGFLSWVFISRKFDARAKLIESK